MKKFNNPILKNVDQIFNTDSMYEVPIFQRAYSWEKSNWTALFDQVLTFSRELVEVKKDDLIFIGNLVLIKNKTNKLDIIDGQQRLTTISILIYCLFKRFDKYSSEVVIENNILKNNLHLKKDHLRDLLLKSQAWGPEDPRIVLQDKDQITYKLLLENLDNDIDMTNKIDSRSKINKCCNEFFKLIDNNIADVEEFYLFCWSLLRGVTFIEINEIDDVFQLFETINSTGMKLKVMDLVKNNVLKKYSEFGDTDNQLSKKWEEKISNNLGNNADKFAYHYLLSKYGKKFNINNQIAVVSNKNLFKIFSLITENMAKDNLETFINDLYSSADEYSKMLEPLKKEIPKVEITDLYRLANFCNITQIRPIILALINWCKIKKISDYKDIASFLENLLNCWFKLMAIGNISPSKIENWMFKIVESIIKDGKFDKEFEDGKKDFPIISEDEIRIFLNKTLSTSNKKYILYKYLVKVGTTSETKIRKEIELEHILPQKPQKWMNTIEWKNTNIDEVTRLKNLLGNNIFIIDKKNKKLSNQIWSKKKEYIFGNSKTLFGIIDKTIIDWESKENILPTDIDERNKRLIDIIINEKII